MRRHVTVMNVTKVNKATQTLLTWFILCSNEVGIDCAAKHAYAQGPELPQRYDAVGIRLANHKAAF